MKNIDTKDKSELSVVTGFGFLGIGKSSIGEKAKELTWKGRPVHHASIDFLCKPTIKLETYVGILLFNALFFRGCVDNYHAVVQDSELLSCLSFDNVLRAYATTLDTSGTPTSFPSPHYYLRPFAFIFTLILNPVPQASSIALSLSVLVPLTVTYSGNGSNGSAL